MGQPQIHSKSILNAEKGVPDSIARIISDIANPLLIPVLVIFPTTMILGLSPLYIGLTTLTALVFFTLIPLWVLMSLLQKGYIQNLDVPYRKNRNRLFGYSIISTTFGSVLLYILCYTEHPFMAVSAVIFFLNPLIGYLINLGCKISIHTAAVASAGILFLALYGHMALTNLWALSLSLIMLLVLLPLMFWSRRQLGIHSFSELVGGCAAGIFFTLIELAIMQTIWQPWIH